MCANSIYPWGHRNSIRFSPMWLFIREQVAINQQLALGYFRALQLPPPPKTDIPYSPLLPLHSSLPIQNDSPHAWQTQRN